ncbi:recombinase family protein [Amycolatopsis japonica]
MLTRAGSTPPGSCIACGARSTSRQRTSSKSWRRIPTGTPIPRRWTHNLVEGLLANPKLTGYQVYNRKATRTGKPGVSRRNPLSDWVWSPRITHEPVINLDERKAAQEVTAGLKAGAEEYPSRSSTCGLRSASWGSRSRLSAAAARTRSTRSETCSSSCRTHPGTGHPARCRRPADGPMSTTVECHARWHDDMWIASIPQHGVYGSGRTLKALRDDLVRGLALLGMTVHVTLTPVSPELDRLRRAEAAYKTALADAVTALTTQGSTARDTAEATGVPITQVTALQTRPTTRRSRTRRTRTL